MKRNVRMALSTAAALTLFGAAPSAQGQESYRLSGGDVAVYNLAGQVEVLAGSGSEVVVEVMRGGDDAEQLRIETGRLDGRQTLRVLYPGDEIVYGEMGRGSRTTVRVRDDGTWGGSGGDRVEIRGSGRGTEAHADLRILVPAGTDLDMYLAVGRIDAAGVQGDLRLDTGSGRVTAADLRGELVVDTGSGSVEVRNVQGAVSVDTGSGSVEIEEASGPELLVDTGSGSVKGSDLRFASVTVDTGSGSVNLESLDAPEIRVDTGSGSVTLGLLADAEYMEVDTGSGSITLRIPDSFGASVEFDTGSGGIDLDVPVQASRIERNYVRGTIGDGNGQVRLDTGSGGIRILRR
jgi:lia operon protein LiaG